jgi:hypothetical protein
MERERGSWRRRGRGEHIAQHARETIRQEVSRPAELHREAADLAVPSPARSAVTAPTSTVCRRLPQGDGGRAMIARTIGRRYAKALMAVTADRGEKPDDLLAELETAAAALAGEPRFGELMANPKVLLSDRLASLGRFLDASSRGRWPAISSRCC